MNAITSRPARARAHSGPRALALCAALTFCTAATAHAYSDNPPDARTGAPGEGTCRDCHSSFPLNGGDGGLTILAPAHYEAGLTYDISVVLSDPGQVRWGFQCSPLTFGTCTITDPANTQLAVFQGKSYVEHTLAGNFTGNPGPVTWSFQWTAPATSPPAQVVFYAAGNAANNSGTSAGDYIYTTSATTQFISTGVEEPVSAAERGLSAWPNPFRTGTLIGFDLAAGEEVAVEVFEPGGRRVAEVWRGRARGGAQVVHWSGRNAAGEPVASGVYLCRLHCASAELFQRLVVLE